MKIEVGKLDKRITLQYYDVNLKQTDAEGFPIVDSEWGTLKTVWASINSLWGREFWAAKATNEETNKTFIIRYSNDLKDLDSKKYRIVYKTKKYDITFIDNIEEANMFYKITAKVVQ